MLEWLRNLLANLILDVFFKSGWMGCESWGSPAVGHW